MVIVVTILIISVLAFLFYASYSIGSGVYVKALCRVATDKKQIALTFDDGVDGTQTPLVLDVLRRHNVKATFFLVGERAQAHPDIVRRMIAEGHTIGIHTWRHQNTFPFGSTDTIMADLQRTCDLLEQITGQRIILFRPPFGVTNPPIGRAVRRLGLVSVGWNIRSYDTDSKKTRADIVQRIERRLQPGAIVLLHDNRADSEALLEKILVMLKTNEYEIIPLNV
ncbi:MAG: polysaccharide deacetylase family protein [Paludibacteraceae bacterium]